MLESDLQKVSALLNSKTRNTRTRINLFRVEARRNNNKISRYLRLLSRVLDLKLRKLNELDPKLKDIDKSIVRLSSSLDKNSSLLERLFQTLSVISERITGISSTENNLSSSIVENISSLSANFLNISENIDSIKITQKEKKEYTSLRDRLKGLSSITKDDIINYLKQNPSLLSALVGLLLGSVPALAATVGKSLGLTKESPRTPQARTNRDLNLPEDTSESRQPSPESSSPSYGDTQPSPSEVNVENKDVEVYQPSQQSYARSGAGTMNFEKGENYRGTVLHDAGYQTLEKQLKFQSGGLGNRSRLGYAAVITREGRVIETANPEQRTYHTKGRTSSGVNVNRNFTSLGFIGGFSKEGIDRAVESGELARFFARRPGSLEQLTTHSQIVRDRGSHLHGGGDRERVGYYGGRGEATPQLEYIRKKHLKTLREQVKRLRSPSVPKSRRGETSPPPVPKSRRGGEVVPPERKDILPEVSDIQTTFSNNDIGAIAAFLVRTQQPQQPPTDPLRFENINYTPLTHPLLKPSPPPSQPLAPPPPPPRQTPIDPTPQIDSEAHMGDT